MESQKAGGLPWRERKKADTRERVLDAAMGLFREKGYDQTAVEEITDAAKIAKGTFFNYFGAKEDILYALLERRLTALEETLHAPREASPDPVTQIKMILKLVAEDPLITHLLSQFAAHGKMPIRQHKTNPLLMRYIVNQVEHSQNAGEIRDDLDPLYIGGMIVALFFHQIAMWYHGYRPFPISQMIDTAIDSLMNGIAGSEWRDPS